MRPINVIVADHYSSPHETALRNQSADPSLERDFVNPLCVNTVGLPSFVNLRQTERGYQRFDWISLEFGKGKGDIQYQTFCSTNFYEF